MGAWRNRYLYYYDNEIKLILGWNDTIYTNVNGTIDVEYRDTYEWSRFISNHTIDNFASDAALKGFISLFLTIVNIVCIIAMGVVILKLKEVTPKKIPQRFSSLWREHVKAHRTTLSKRRGAIKDQNSPYGINTDKLLEEVSDILKVDDTVEDGQDNTFLQTLFDKARHETDYQEICRAAGRPISHPNSTIRHRQKSRRLSVGNVNHPTSTNFSDVFHGSKLSVDAKNKNNHTLYRQAKMIQRSRSIGVAWKKRALSRRMEQIEKSVKDIPVSYEDSKIADKYIPYIDE